MQTQCTINFTICSMIAMEKGPENYAFLDGMD
jgi:hypothetical protein